MALALGIGLFQLSQVEQGIIPSFFQGASNQAVFGINGVILTLSQVNLITRLLKTKLPLPVQNLTFSF